MTKTKKKKKYWCDLTEEQADKKASQKKTTVKQCGNSQCFDCYGDRNN